MTRELDFDKEIEMLLSSKSINSYMATYLVGLGKAGLNEELWQEALDDAMEASNIGVDSEEDFLTFFYIDHFVEDIAEDIFGIQMDKEDEASLKQHLFDMRTDVDFGNISTYRAGVFNWLQSRQKVERAAHPNRGVPYKALPKYDNENWRALAERIRKSILIGFSREFALKEAAHTLNAPEKYDFLLWYNHYMNGLHTKYDVNDRIKMRNKELKAMASFTKLAIGSDDHFYYVPTFRSPAVEEHSEEPFFAYSEQDAADFEVVRKKLMSRVFAIDKLLERYRRVLTEEHVDGIEEALNDLRKKIRKLKLASSVQDSIVKTAHILRNKFSFDEGADALIALAQGGEAPAQGGEADFEDPSAGHLQITDNQQELYQVIEELYAVSHQLKNRQVIRDLAKIDLNLYNMNMSSFFPELTDAQSRLIEAFGYASNKVDDILPKLRGGLMIEQLQDETIADEQGEQLADEVKEMAKNTKVPESAEPEPSVNTKVPLQEEAPAVEKPEEANTLAQVPVV